jgi:hypothetical protein
MNPDKERAKSAGGGRRMTEIQVEAALKRLGSAPRTGLVLRQAWDSSCPSLLGRRPRQGGLRRRVSVLWRSCILHLARSSCAARRTMLDWTMKQDGGQNGAIQCMENDECCGMYLTGICEGRFELDSGKLHDHCTQCPGFGKCIGDYREAHCNSCGSKHYIQGLSGFACDCHRGGGGGGGLLGVWDDYDY